MLANFGLKLQIGKPQKNFDSKMYEALKSRHCQLVRHRAGAKVLSSQQYNVTNHFEVIIVTNSEKGN